MRQEPVRSLLADAHLTSEAQTSGMRQCTWTMPSARAIQACVGEADGCGSPHDSGQHGGLGPRLTGEQRYGCRRWRRRLEWQPPPNGPETLERSARTGARIATE